MYPVRNVAGLHDMILLVDGYSAILPFVESGFDGRFESSRYPCTLVILY